MILKTLQREYLQVAQNSDFDFAVLGVTFEGDKSKPWWEFAHIPNDPEDQYYGNEDIKRGIIRVFLHWPLKNTGDYEPLRQLEQFINHFKKGVKFADDDGEPIEIYRIPRYTGKFSDDTGTVFPLSVWYRSFRP